MVAPESKDFSSSKVKPYESIYINNVKNDLAILKYNEGWNNFFSWCEGAIKLLMEITDAMTPEQNIIDLRVLSEEERRQTELQPLLVHKLRQLWWGGCKVTKNRYKKNPTLFVKNSTRFHYDNSKLPKKPDLLLEITPYPAMDSMTPVGHIRDPTLMIQITEAIPLYFAWRGMDYDTVVREGGFYYRVGQRLVAKFPPHEMYSKIKKTYKIGRNTYHNIMRIQKRKFLENWIPVQNRCHKIVQFQESHNLSYLLEKVDKVREEMNTPTIQNHPSPPPIPQDWQIPIPTAR